MDCDHNFPIKLFPDKILFMCIWRLGCIGKTSARVFKRAQVLKHFDEGKTSPTIASFAGVTVETAGRIGWNYVHEGLDRALFDLPHKGADGRYIGLL